MKKNGGRLKSPAAARPYMENGGHTMRKWGKNFSILFILILSFMTAAFLFSCEGSEVREAIDNTVEEVTGGKLIKKGEALKQQIRDLNAKDIERIQKEIEKGVYGQEE
jgi:hypothetical protein